MTTLFIIGRIIFGGYFIFSGYNHFANDKGMIGFAQSKGVPMAANAVYGTAVLLILGGLSIITGVYVRIGITLLTVFLIGVTFTMHQFWKATDPMQKMGEQINFTKNMGLLGGLLMLLMIPLPWVASLF